MGIFTIIGIGIALLAGGASYVQSKQAQKKAKKLANSMAGVLLNKESNIEPLPVVYGSRRVGGVRVFVETNGSSNEYLYMALALCEGEVGSIAGIEIDGVSRFDSRFSGLVAFQTHTGADDQAASSLLIGAPSWTNSHRLRGVAYLSVRLKWDQNAFSGIPEITALVTGKRVYDPRNGNTTWSSNPALCIRDYLTNERYGKGLPASAIDDTAFAAAANDCDSFSVTPYSGATSNIDLFECNAVIDTGEEIFRNVERMLLGCRGFLPYTQGKYALYIDQSKTHTLDLTLDNIIGGISFAGEKKEDKFNRVIVKFPNPSTKWQEDAAIWPDAGSTEESTYLGEDNDVLLVDEVEMETITNYYAARDFARIFLLRSRNGMRVSLQATSEAINLVVGDVVRLTHPTPSFTNKPFQVEQVTLNYDGTVNLDLLEYDSTIYTYDTAAEETDYPDTDLPDPFTIAEPTALTLTESTRTEGDGTIIPSVLVQWTAADDFFVSSYEVQYKLQSASTYKSLITGATEFDITLPESGADYDIRVRSINSAGVRSGFISDQISIVGDNVAPGTPANGSTDADVHLLVVTWDNPSDSDFSYTEVKRSNDATEGNATSIAKISGESFTDGPFAVGTTRYYWLRAVDRTGNASAWVSAGSDTTAAIVETDIADGAVTIDKFGTGLEPIQVVSSLPGSATAGQMAFLTTDSKLYRYNGTAWTAAIPVGDVTDAGDLAALDTITLSYVTDAGDVAALDSISETYIDDDSITTVKINANAVTAAKIQANTITAAQIAANTLTANEIASNTITANQIAANTITAGQIAAGTITATEIAAGTITADELAANSVTGQVFDAASYLRAGSGDNSAVMSGRTIDEFAFWAGKGFESDGGPSGGDAPFRVTRDGKVIMTNFALYSEAGTKLFDSQDGLLALPQTAVAQASGSLVPEVSEELTSGTDTFTVTLTSTQTITANFSYPVGALYYSGTSLANALANVSSAFAVTLEYSADSGSTWNTFGSAQSFSRVTSGTPTASQFYVDNRELTISIIYGAAPSTIYIASLQSNTGAIDEGAALVGSTSQSLGAGTYLIRMVFSATGGSGTGAPSTTKTREVRLTTSGSGFTVSNGVVSDGVGTSATTGWVLSNFVEKTESDNVTINGTLTLGGDLVVNGTTTTINSTTLTVDDKNIVLADGAANAAAADGAGVTIDGANASLTYVSASDTLEVNKGFRVADSSDMGFGTAKAGSSIAHTASVHEGIFWHTASDYGISRTPGAWTGPGYPYLKVSFLTGIKLNGGTAGQYNDSGVDIVGGSDLQMAGNTVIDASRNITAGTISSGAITSTGTSTFARIRLNNSNTSLNQGSGNALRITTNSGYVDIGPQNTSYMHFDTDRAKFYFGQPVHFDGQIYNFNSGATDQPYWHAGNDGSGSGLDADKLDSYEYTQFNGVVARYRTTGSASGRIRITLPLNTNSARMLKFTISQQSSYHQRTFEVSGYLYPTTNNWYLPRCVYTGTTDPDIIVGRDANGKAYVSIANGNYTGIIVHSVTGGYQGADSDGYGSWTIAANNGTENSVSVEVHKTWNSRNDGSGSGLDADLLDGVQGSLFLRSDQDATIDGMTIIKRGIKASGHIRAAGWYNEAADTGYEGMAFEIGTSSGSPYAIAYDRSNSTYGNMKFDANSFQFFRGNVTVDNNITANGNIYADGTVYVNENNSGARYLWLKRPAGTDGHLIFQEGNGLKWQNRGGTDLIWYSYTAAATTFQLEGSGGANILVGGLKVGSVEVIDSNRTLYANGATGAGFAGTSGVAIGGQYPAVSFESSSGYHKWLQYVTSSNAFILYNQSNSADVFRVYATSLTQQDIAFGTQGNTSWSTGGRTTFNINGNSTSLLGFHCAGATRGYLFASSSALELLSYGELKLQASASSSYQATLNADGLIVEDGLYANGIADRNGDILYPEGGTLKAVGSSNVGAIKIRLPVNNSATMMKMRVSVYIYDGSANGRSFTLEVGGYNFSGGNWYNYFANVIGNTANDLQYNVRFGHDGTKDCIWIGETTTNWPYVQVVVENVCPGYNNYSQAVWRTGWSVSLDTSLGTVERTITANHIGRHCRGSFTSAGNVTAYASDARLKKNITPITNALEKVKRLRGVEFDWIDECEEMGFKPDTKHETGVIAQEVQAVISDAVYPAPFNPDYLTVQKDKIVPVLINAVQELIQEVDSLKAKLKELENGND